MKSLLLVAVLSVTLTAVAQQQTGAPAGVPVPTPPASTSAAAGGEIAPDSQVFRIRVLDGRTGAPLHNAHLQIWYDEPSGSGVEVSTGPAGFALMPAPVGQPLRVLVHVANFRDCRHTPQYGPPLAYNMAEIAKGGTAAENTCGQLTQHTKRGELLLFARPAHWYEGLNRTPQ